MNALPGQLQQLRGYTVIIRTVKGGKSLKKFNTVSDLGSLWAPRSREDSSRLSNRTTSHNGCRARTSKRLIQLKLPLPLREKRGRRAFTDGATVEASDSEAAWAHEITNSVKWDLQPQTTGAAGH